MRDPRAGVLLVYSLWPNSRLLPPHSWLLAGKAWLVVSLQPPPPAPGSVVIRDCCCSTQTKTFYFYFNTENFNPRVTTSRKIFLTCGTTTNQLKLCYRKKYSQRRKKLWDSELVWRQSSVILVWDWVEERNNKDDGELNLRSDDTDMTECESSERNKVVLEVSGHWPVKCPLC